MPYARLVQYAIVLRPALPLPDHRRPGPQLRRPRRAAAVRLPAPARRPALDRQPAHPRLEAAAAGRHRPAAPRSRRSTATASTAPSWPTGWRRTSWSPRYVPPHPSSTWAQGTVALPLDGPPKGLTDAVLPDEFPLNIFYEALRKKLATSSPHLRDHRMSTATPGRRLRGGRVVVVAGAAGAAGPPLVARLAARGRDRRRRRRQPGAAGAGRRPGQRCRRERRQRARRGRRPAGPEATLDWAASVLEEFGRVDGLVHLVGGWRGGASFTETAWPTGRCCRTCWSARCSTPRWPSTTASGPATTRASCSISHGRRHRPIGGQRRLRGGQGRRGGLDPGGGRLRSGAANAARGDPADQGAGHPGHARGQAARRSSAATRTSRTLADAHRTTCG